MEDGSPLQSLPMLRTIPRHLLLILLVTAGVYATSIANGFLNLDDTLLVTENSHVQNASFSSVAYVFTHFDPELYIPVTLLSYQLETWILGSSAWHFHIVELLLHLIAVSLVFAITMRLSHRTAVALITATLFAIHPLNAEAVLWIAARKDLLSSVFALGALLAYLRAREHERFPVLACTLFLLALGSKVSVVALPIALFFYEYGQRTLRSSWGRLLVFVIPAFVFGIVAILGKEVVESEFSVGAFAIMAFRSMFFYLQLILLPESQAAAHHLLPHDALRSPIVPLAIAGIIGLGVIAWKTRRSLPLMTAGITFFFIMIAPSLLHYTQGNGMMQLGAERYAYLASSGIFLAIATSMKYLSRAVSAHVRLILVTTGIIILGILGYLTVLRSFVFADSVIFNVDILQKHPHDARAWYGLGQALEKVKRPQEAETAYGNALTYEPAFQESAIALGILLTKEGRTDEGISMLRHAVEIKPDGFKGHFNLGVALQNLKRYPEAEQAYRSSIERFSEFPLAHENLAVVLGLQGKKAEAIAEYEILATLDPDFQLHWESLKAESSGKKTGF